MPAIWDLINMSDAYSFETDNHEAAALATIILGEGQYGAREIGGAGRDVPLLLFGNGAAWYSTTFGRAIGEGLDALNPEVAEVLDSVLIGPASDRARMDDVFAAITDPADRAAARAAYHDGKRSSVNDIGRRAIAWAEALRNKAVEAPRAPQQVFGV